MKVYRCGSYGYFRNILEYNPWQAIVRRLTGRKPRRFR